MDYVVHGVAKSWTQLSDFQILPGGSDGELSAYNAGDLGSILGSGRSPRKGNGNQLQYSCLENPMDGGTWLGYILWGHKELDRTERLHSLRSHRFTCSALDFSDFCVHAV